MQRTIIMAAAVNINGIYVPAGTYVVDQKWGETLRRAGGTEGSNGSAVAATKTSTEAAGATARVTYTAVAAGEDGSDIFIKVVDGAALSVLVVGKGIQVTVNAGVSTAANVVAAVNGDAGAAALVTAVAAGDGLGFPTAAGQPGYLVGGVDADSGHPPIEYVSGIGWQFVA